MSSLVFAISLSVLIFGVGLAAGLTLLSLISQPEIDYSDSEEQTETCNNNLEEQINLQKDR